VECHAFHMLGFYLLACVCSLYSLLNSSTADWLLPSVQIIDPSELHFQSQEIQFALGSWLCTTHWGWNIFLHSQTSPHEFTSALTYGHHLIIMHCWELLHPGCLCKAQCSIHFLDFGGFVAHILVHIKLNYSGLLPSNSKLKAI
jgi:hypothetical protein